MFASLSFSDVDNGLLKSDGLEILIDSGFSLRRNLSLACESFDPKAFSLTTVSVASSDNPKEEVSNERSGKIVSSQALTQFHVTDPSELIEWFKQIFSIQHVHRLSLVFIASLQ